MTSRVSPSFFPNRSRAQMSITIMNTERKSLKTKKSKWHLADSHHWICSRKRKADGNVQRIRDEKKTKKSFIRTADGQIVQHSFAQSVLPAADVHVNRRWLTKFSNDLVTENRSVNAENITDDERYFTGDNRHSTSKFNLISSRLSLNLHVRWTSKLSHCLFSLSLLSPFLCPVTFLRCHTVVSERLFLVRF